MSRIAFIATALWIFGCSQPGDMTAEEAENVAVIQAQSEAFNAKEPGIVERFYSEDMVYRSYGPWAPQGMTADREQLAQGIAFGMRAFPDRRTTTLSLIVDGDTVVEETEWVATASDQHPTLAEGERQVARVISFSRFRDGKIVELREYAVLVAEAPTQAAAP